MTKAPRFIVTRPQPECSRWVSAIEAQGLSAVALPLIDIVSTPFTLDASKRYAAVMFVSRSAVDGFFKFQTVDALQALRVLVTGPGTAASLMGRGLAQSGIDQPCFADGQFDSEALWRVVGSRDWRGKQVLVVRGANRWGEAGGRNWLADQLVHAGASVDFVVAYERRLPALSDANRLVLEHPVAGDVCLFSSSQAVAHLRALWPMQDWSGSRALTTHPRIQTAAQQAGFGKVDVVRPLLPDIIAWLKAN